MARTPKLNDLHYVLLATAANRASGGLLPPSSSVKAERASITRAVRSLISRSFAEEVETRDRKSVWREEGQHQLTAVITAAGRTAIHIADGKAPEDEAPAAAPATKVGPADQLSPPEAAAPGARAGTKQALLIAMLRCEHGVTLSELAEATSWLPHTTRAALTGLRKKGHAIAAEKQDGVSRYRLAAPGARDGDARSSPRSPAGPDRPGRRSRRPSRPPPEPG